MKIKRLFAILLVLSMTFMLFGCKGKDGDTDDKTTPAPTEATEAGPDYESMSMDELYELAKKESGTITVYSTTTSAQTAAKKFQKQFPDLKVEYIESDTDSVANRIKTESDSGHVAADVLMVKDNSGEVYYELVLEKYLDLYYPKAVCEHIDDSLLTYGMPLFATYSTWYYNTKMYPDGCPLTSWWDIVEGYNPETENYTDGNGNNTQFWTIYTKDITSPSYSALWCQLVIDGDALTEQYEKQYGKPLEFTYMKHLSNEPGLMYFPDNNGGVELFWRFTQMNITGLGDGDAVVAAVDESLNGPTLGLCSASKLDNQASGSAIDWVRGLQPYTAFLACDYVYSIKGCDNPAGARLFTLYCLGGDDGQSGCLSVFNTIGRWSVRDDFVFEKSPYSIEEVNLKSPDFEDIYSYFLSVTSYWTKWSGKKR
jgi:iron(III) transport system substrate-binding protein